MSNARVAKSVTGRAGRDVVSARMLLTLWTYAISVGVGSGREIERRQSSDPAFHWIVGDQRVGWTKLNEFRSTNLAAFEKLFSDVLGRCSIADWSASIWSRRTALEQAPMRRPRRFEGKARSMRIASKRCFIFRP